MRTSVTYYLVASTAILWAAPPCISQTVSDPASLVAPAPEVTVDDLVSRALKNNPQLPIARQASEAARLRLGAAGKPRNPTLELVPGFAGSREARDEEILLAQPLDLFGQRRARAGVAAAEFRRTQAELTLAERSLIVAVKNAAAEVFAAQEAESLGEVQAEVARLFRDAAARRAELGDVPAVQAQRADLEVLRVQNELTNVRAERLARLATLNQLVGQAPEAPLRVALPLDAGLTDLLRVRPTPFQPGATPAPAAPAAPPTAPTLGASAQVGSNLVGMRAQLVPNALRARPDVIGAQATLEARRAQSRVLRSERLPNVEVQARRSSFFGSGSYALRAVVTMPIFDFGSLRGEQRAVEADVRAQQATVNLLQSQVALQIEQALVRLEQQRQTVGRYRNGILPLTVELLRKTQVGYTQGASTYLEVLEAQRTLRLVQTEYLQALVGTRTSEAALEGALGAALPAGITGIPTALAQ